MANKTGKVLTASLREYNNQHAKRANALEDSIQRLSNQYTPYALAQKKLLEYHYACLEIGETMLKEYMEEIA